MAKAEDNLQAAFGGESMANRKYLAFAKVADREGFPQVARLFRTAAAAETVHAHNHLRAMGGIGKTADNLQVAIEGETYEFTEMYPTFLAEAREEGHKKAELSFGYANAAEKVHADMYTRAAEAVARGEDLPEVEMAICPICGHTVEGEPPEVCPVCGATRAQYVTVE